MRGIPRGWTLVYPRVLEVRAQKGEHSNWPHARFKHKFSSTVALFGAPDGTMHLVPVKVCRQCGGIDVVTGRRIWKTFRYPDRRR